jgi:TM2 domain-containing membrane protein YozV
MTDSQRVETSNRKLAAGLLAIFLGSLGIHKFVLGYSRPGLIMLLVTVLTCGFGGSVMGIIGIIEGVIYLTKTPEEFQAQYIDATREWF